jgi:hypothetical protein
MKRNLTSYFITAFTSLCCITAKSQVSFTNGENVLEISGVMSTYYNHRFLDASVANNHVGNVITAPLNEKKNSFALGTCRFNFQGMYGRKYEYRFQFDLAQLGYSNNTGEFPSVLDAYFIYKPLRDLRVTIGYQKLPYSANSLASYATQPYWQRAEITRGYIFSRRDVGITLKQSFYNERINIYAGIYSGMGEYNLTSVTNGDNDPSGKPEVVGRIDFSTVKYNYNDIYDIKYTNTPAFNLGFNGRYTEKLNSLVGITDYDLKIISGYKKVYGMDAAFMYKGFSGQFEIHQLNIVPTGSDTTRLQGKKTNYFNAGGLFGQINYYNKKWKTGIYLRYDNFIPNDLISNNMEQTVSFGFNVFLKGTRSMLRTQYFYRLDKSNAALLRTSDQARIGWQYTF